MKKSLKQPNNGGFTLIELIVSLLVCSFVVLSASFFLSMGVRSYTHTNQEVSLQMESQIANDLIEGLVIESSSCEFVPNFSYKATDGTTGTCGLLKIGTTDGVTTTLYLVIHDKGNNRLLLKKLTAPATETNNYVEVVGELFNQEAVVTLVGDAITAEYPDLLANYCGTFIVRPYEMHVDTDDLVRISTEFVLNGKNFKASTNVSMRNGEHK